MIKRQRRSNDPPRQLMLMIILIHGILFSSILSLASSTPVSSSSPKAALYSNSPPPSASSPSTAVPPQSLQRLSRGGRRRRRDLFERIIGIRGGASSQQQHQQQGRSRVGSSFATTTTDAAGGEGKGGAAAKRNKTAEWEAGAEWLTNQVLLYQTHLSISSEALGKRRACVAPTTFDLGLDNESNKPPLEIAEATETETYECRIHGEVEPGSKVVAPCRCRGTAKWMWFADMNRRRRRDPIASRTCGTCHTVIDYGAYQKFGSVLCKAVSWPLDHKIAFRFMIGAGAFLSSLVLAVPASVVVIRLLTSNLFWRTHGLWSRVFHGPLPLKVVLYQYVGRYIWSIFLKLEGIIREQLAEAESTFLERSLPVTYHQPSK